jgi:DNA-binding NarL/FixJ family response regulator
VTEVDLFLAPTYDLPRGARVTRPDLVLGLLDIGRPDKDDRAGRELAATGETVPKRTVDTGLELTAQEAQIARLAAEGPTNHEISAALFLSNRTVE